MTFDTQSSSTTILPPRRPTTLPASTPSDVRQVANRQGGSANDVVQSAIAQSGGAVIPLNNFTHGPSAAPSASNAAAQTGTIAVVDDVVSSEVNAQVIPFNEMARRRLMGAPEVPTNALALPAGPEDSMPFVADGAMGAVEAPKEEKSNVWPWLIAAGAIAAVLWKFSQDDALHGAPLVADLDETEGGEADESEGPEGSEE